MDTIHTFIYARWVQNQFSWETDKANSCDHLKVFFQLIYTHESEETKSALYNKLKLTNTMCIGTHYMRYTYYRSHMSSLQLFNDIFLWVQVSS